MSPSRLLAKGDCGDGPSEGKRSLCFAASSQTFPFCHWEEHENKGNHIFLLRSKRCSSQTGRTDVDTWINFPADMWELLVSSVGMLVNTIFLDMHLRLLGHRAFDSPFQPHKGHRDVGCLSKCAIKNGLVVTLCSPSLFPAAGLG